MKEENENGNGGTTSFQTSSGLNFSGRKSFHIQVGGPGFVYGRSTGPINKLGISVDTVRDCPDGPAAVQCVEKELKALKKELFKAKLKTAATACSYRQASTTPDTSAEPALNRVREGIGHSHIPYR